jgi:hypothetical protein
MKRKDISRPLRSQTVSSSRSRYTGVIKGGPASGSTGLFQTLSVSNSQEENISADKKAISASIRKP